MMSDNNVPQAVVFDLDGLMFNTEELLPGRGLGAFAPPRLRVFRRTARRDDGPAQSCGLANHDRLAWIAGHGRGPRRETEELFPPILDARLQPMPGLVELLGALERKGIPKAIATSSGRRFVDSVLSRFTFGPHFDFILTAESVTEGKPHPEIYQSAAAQFGVPPADMVVLEDSATGCRAAVAAGRPGRCRAGRA